MVPPARVGSVLPVSPSQLQSAPQSAPVSSSQLKHGKMLRKTSRSIQRGVGLDADGLTRRALA